LQPIQPVLGESSPPLTDDLRAHLQTGRDLGVRGALGGKQHDLGALHIAIGQRQPRRARPKLTALLIGESDVDRPRHHTDDSPTAL
jgi:hypothetical protein